MQSLAIPCLPLRTMTLQEFPSSRFFTQKKGNRRGFAEAKFLGQQGQQANVFLAKREAGTRLFLVRHTDIVAYDKLLVKKFLRVA